MASDLRKRKGTWIFGHASVTFWIRRFGSAMWAVGPRHAAGTARATSAVQVLNDGRNIDGLGFVRALPEAAPIKNRDVGTRHWVPLPPGDFPLRMVMGSVRPMSKSGRLIRSISPGQAHVRAV